MILRQNVSLRTLRRNNEYLTRIQIRAVSIPLPKSLRKYEDTPNLLRPGVGRAESKNESTPLRPGVSSGESSRRTRQRRKEESPDDKPFTRPDGTVEAYLAANVAEVHGLTVRPPSKLADQVFRRIPAYVSRAFIDPTAILKLWPTLNQLLPQDPMNVTVTGTHGTRSLYSWSPTSDDSSEKSVVNMLQLGWTLPMYANAIDPLTMLFDGTDTRFLPGPPRCWPYRVWSSGSLKHCVLHPPRLHHTLGYHHVLEKPVSVRVLDGMTKVTIRKSVTKAMGRRLGDLYTGANMLKLIDQTPSRDLNDYTGPFAAEEYSLVFFKNPPKTLSGDDPKIVLPPEEKAEFSHTLTLNRHHLFCWSGITQNAHLIHLDSQFAKREYGAKDLVVQGPFTVFLILEWLRRMLTAKALNKLDKFALISIDYKIYLPIFVDESIKFCARPLKRPTPGSISPLWRVWIEKTDPESGRVNMTFTATVTAHTQRWDGQDVFQTDEDESLDRSQTEAPEKPAQEQESDGISDDLESDEFSSPFFKR